MHQRRPAEVERAGRGGTGQPGRRRRGSGFLELGRVEKGEMKTKTPWKAIEPLHCVSGRQLEAGRWSPLSFLPGAPFPPSSASPAALLGVQPKDFEPLLLSAWLISLSGFFCRWK